jgi:hypothetical protein
MLKQYDYALLFDKPITHKTLKSSFIAAQKAFRDKNLIGPIFVYIDIRQIAFYGLPGPFYQFLATTRGA